MTSDTLVLTLDNVRPLPRSGRRRGRWGSVALPLALLLGLSLLGAALPGRAVLAAGPLGGRGAAAGLGRVAHSSVLPAGLAPVLRRALGLSERASEVPLAQRGLRALAVGSRQGLLEPDTTWSQQAELTASDGTSNDYLGFSVAVSGTTALVGTYGKNNFAGAAYVFVRSGSTWSQQAKLTAADGAANDRFGWSVAVSGGTALVGAPDKNSGAGAAYMFVRSGTSWSQQAELTASDGAASDYFGYAVALNGSTALIGANGKDGSAGAAYVFVRSGTSWSQQAELTAADGAANDNFGQSVALSGGTALVGAYGNNSNTGAAYVFVRSGTSWSQQAELTAADGAANDNFGQSVALSGTTALVGANGHNNAGAAYVFVRSRASWSQQAELTASDGAAGAYFGYAVALSGNSAVVGAPLKNSSTGAAYVFVRV